MSRPRRVEIRRQTRLFDDFFKIDEVIVAHERQDGTMSPDQRRLIFERGDAVAALLYNPHTDTVVVVNQFKVPTLIARRRDDPGSSDGWVTEAIAGMIDGNETPEQAIIRETMEEAGYAIRNPEHICAFFSSAGGTSERVFLYFAEVSDADKTGKGGGLEGEDVSIVQMSARRLFEQLSDGQIEDPKLAVAGYWLKDRLRTQGNPGEVAVLQDTIGDLLRRVTMGAERWLDEHLRGPEKMPLPTTTAAARPVASAPAGPLPLSTVRYALKKNPNVTIGYKTGLIDAMKDVSIWVNSENTDMLMDRVIGRSISSRIRFLGSNKDDEGNILEDTIAEDLRAAVGSRGHVRIGTVLVTESGSLKASHRVGRILHVATVQASLGGGVKANRGTLAACVVAVLDRAEKLNRRSWNIARNFLRERIGLKPRYYESILIPMIGAGEGGLEVEDVARTVIPAAIEYMASLRLATLREVYFIAFNQRTKAACDAVLDAAAADDQLAKLGAA
jgi:nudix-type nucleoside diphosphatase (YffH/AdpP family)